VNGAFSTKIRTELLTGAITIEENDYTVIISNATSVGLPSPATSGLGINIGKIYVLKNITGGAITISSYVNSDGSNTAETNLPMGVTQLQSDGSNWQQIN